MAKKAKTSNWIKPAIESSYIKFIKWDEGNVLSVEFSTGAKFKYQNVSKEKFKEFRDASSAGRFFHAEIKAKEDIHPFEEIM